MPPNFMADGTNILWRRKRKYFDIFQIGNFITPALTGGANTLAQGAAQIQPKDATVFPFEVNDYGIVGAVMAADDLIYPRLPVPLDLDPAFPVRFRINFTQSAAVSVGVLWILLQGIDKKDATMLAEDAGGIAALDTALVEKNAGGAAWENLYTDWGVRTSIGLTQEEIVNGAMFRCSLELQTVDGTIADPTLLGLEMEYTCQRILGAGQSQESRSGI